MCRSTICTFPQVQVKCDWWTSHGAAEAWAVHNRARQTGRVRVRSFDKAGCTTTAGACVLTKVYVCKGSGARVVGAGCEHASRSRPTSVVALAFDIPLCWLMFCPDAANQQQLPAPQALAATSISESAHVIYIRMNLLESYQSVCLSHSA